MRTANASPVDESTAPLVTVTIAVPPEVVPFPPNVALAPTSTRVPAPTMSTDALLPGEKPAVRTSVTRWAPPETDRLPEPPTPKTICEAAAFVQVDPAPATLTVPTAPATRPMAVVALVVIVEPLVTSTSAVP